VYDVKGSALHLPTTTMSVVSLFEQIVPYTRLIGSNGGVTLSGGEALLQLPAALELLSYCKQRGIHTAVETSGLLPVETYRTAAILVDLWLFGMRVITGENHSRHDAHIDAVLAELSSVSAKILPRIPLIPTFFDREDVIESLLRLLNKYNLEEVCLNRWNMDYDLFYRQSGIPLSMPLPVDDAIELCHKRFTSLNLKIYENN
jgi:pyruvate formate lyase activating enzyme